MKRFFTALALLLTFTLSISAMSYEQARNQALFLTDKMAYELNLTDQQYEAAYEINLDYLMRIDDASDLYGAYWRQRNLDLSYILLDWQYRAYVDASYFYRPLYWDAGFWHFGIYARYPHRDFFYFGCPNFVWTYAGGHSWMHNGGHSWYHGRSWDGPRDGGMNPGMRHNWDNGRYGGGFIQKGQRSWSQAPRGGVQNGNRSFGSQRQNSNSAYGVARQQSNGNRTFGTQRQNSNGTLGSSNGNRSFGTPRQSSTRSTVNRSQDRSFGNSSAGNLGETPRGTFQQKQSSPSRTYSAPTRSSSSSSFGGGHSSSSSFGGGHSSGSFGGGHSSGGSFGRR
jgi:hypothetical protein